MCFQNHGPTLAQYRARKQPITVWKTGQIDNKTGLVKTKFDSSGYVWWIKGQIVHPHKIREPLKHNVYASAGLYFHTDKCHAKYGTKVKASVKPKDIIAVSLTGSMICTIAAKVLEAPNPDPKLMRRRYLKEQLIDARETVKHRKESIRRWEKEREEQEEAIEQMAAEIKELGGIKT